MTWGRCSVGILDSNLAKSRLAHNVLLSCQILLKFCTEHSSITPALCGNFSRPFQNLNVCPRRTRFYWIWIYDTFIATAPGLRMAWYYFITFGDIEILCVRNLAVAARENLTSIVVFTFPERVFINGTVECRYNAVQFIMILSSALQRQQQNINQTSNSRQTPHIPPSRVSYGVSIVRIWEKIDRVIMTPHFICEIVLKFCTEHDSDTAVLCAKFQNDLTTEQ